MHKLKLIFALSLVAALGSVALANSYASNDVIVKEVDLGSCLVLPDLTNITLDDLDLTRVEGNELPREIEEHVANMVLHKGNGPSSLYYLDFELTNYLGDDQPQTFFVNVQDRSTLQVDYFAKHRTLLIIQDRFGKSYEKEISTMQSLSEAIVVEHKFEVILAKRSVENAGKWIPAGTVEEITSKILGGLKTQNDANLKEIKLKAKKFILAQSPNKCP